MIPDPCLSRIKELIDQDIRNYHTVDKIVNSFHIDRQILHEQFIYFYGISPKQYIQERRLAVLKELILRSRNGHSACFYAQPLGFKAASSLRTFVNRSTGKTFDEFKKDFVLLLNRYLKDIS
ncbi:helix-turn-helix transcriptional regulator [bacterium]|nr:helix-turn-helix transcriptional regulator [bacterium]